MFLTINESIDDVVNSIKIISDFTDVISLEPISIQKNTLVEYLWERNSYIPPKGWIIKDILKELSELNTMHKFELRIGGFEYFPIPDLVINNCNLCNKELYEAIDDFNSTKELQRILSLNCECYDNYLEEKSREERCELLDERISNIMNNILKNVV